MSRRSRKRASGVKSNKLGIIAVLLLITAVVGVGVVHSMVRNYLRSEGFRVLLSEKVSDAANVEGEFSAFRWDGLAVDTDSYQAGGKGLIRKMELEGLHTEVGLGKIWDGVWQIQGSRVREIDIVLDTQAPPTPPKAVVIDEVTMQPKEKKSWMPSEFELEKIDIQELNLVALLESGQVSLTRAQVQVKPVTRNRAYDISLAGGTLNVPYDQVPAIRLDEANLRYQENKMFLKDLTADVWSSGRLISSGEMDLKSKRYAFQGSVEGVKCSEVLSENWAKKVTGNISTSYTVVNHGVEPQAEGRLVIRNGVITALPLLDTLAAYADTTRFRVLNLNEAETDWKWRGGDLELTNILLESDGLMRVEGDLAIRGEKLDGKFMLGLAPGTLSRIPGAETDVFKRGDHGLMWAPVRITGTLDKPKEDLKNRLIAAAGMRLFTIAPETGAKVLKFSGRTMKDLPEKLLNGGGDSKDLIEGVAEGLLNGLLGGDE